MNKILVLFDSKTGNVAAMARLVAEGAQTIPDTEVRLRSVDEASAADVEWCDGLAVGSPTNMGVLSWKMKRFWDETMASHWMKVDGKIVVDSSKTYFIPNSTVDLKYDYVTVNQVHTIELQAYGIVNSITPASQLFDGSTTFTATSGLDASIPLTLNWVGPTTGKASLSVLIGKVGQITVNATATGVLIP